MPHHPFVSALAALSLLAPASAKEAGSSGFLEVSNGETDGRVVIDGARWVWLGE